MERPTNIDMPFFAYGLFRPGQLAFFQLRELVGSVSEPAQVAGRLYLRDGLPIADPNGRGFIKGALLTFLPEQAGEAYGRIAAMEPGKHYRWDEVLIDGVSINVLIGKSPRRGSVPCEDAEWNGWCDPLFTEALDVVEETIKSQTFDWDLKPLFRLQMAYLLLWSSIERYVSLRYHLGKNATDKVKFLAHESAFAESLRQHVPAERIGHRVYRADQPAGAGEVLVPELPGKAVEYYYQIRSNIVHRGKGAVRDYELIKASLSELLLIFREVLKAAESDARLVDLRTGCY